MHERSNVEMENSMTAKPWDRTPWPANGDATESVTFEAVGRALTCWERLEGQLCTLFEALLGFSVPSPAATRSFAAIRTSEARLTMLRSAGQAFFSVSKDAQIEADFNDLLVRCVNYASRRND